MRVVCAFGAYDSVRLYAETGRTGGVWAPRRSWSYAWFWLRSAACDSSSCCELAS